jgi:hypothetical protein
MKSSTSNLHSRQQQLTASTAFRILSLNWR